MKTLFITFMIILVVSTPVVASFDEWTSLQKGLGIAYGGLIVTDLIQTQHWGEYTKENPRIINGEKVWEVNPLYAGRDMEEITLMFIGINYLGYEIADRLDSNYRTMFLLASTLIEGKVVYDNHKTMEKLGFEYKINFFSFGF